MNDGSRQYPPGTMRASDADRDAVVAELGEHFQAGRLTVDELDERTGVALQARTFGELAPLTADLPPIAPAGQVASQSGRMAARAGRAWPPAPVVVGLIAVAVVAAALLSSGTGARGSHAWWLILVVPLVARRMMSRRRR